MDYRGIITQGYYVDAGGGQNRTGIITQGDLMQITVAAFVASTRKIVEYSENRIIEAQAGSDDRIIIAAYESRITKGSA